MGSSFRNTISWLALVAASGASFSPYCSADIYDVLRKTADNHGMRFGSLQDISAVAPETPKAPPPKKSIASLYDQAKAEKQGQRKQSKQRKRPTLREEAFQEVLNKTFPLKPEQIIKLRQELDKSQQAVHTHPSTPPQPISSTVAVDLSPGAPSPLIRLATGFVSSLVFVDVTGAPWPVADYSLGNPTSFNIQWDTRTNTLFVQSLKPYVTANLAVRLAELDTPVMITLVTGQKEVDYRADLQIRAHGPNATIPMVDSNLPEAAPPELVSILDGIPPPGSREIQVSGDHGKAWITNGKLLFRTQLTVLSPAWAATVSSPDGTRVYELSQTPLILAAKNGKPIKIALTGL